MNGFERRREQKKKDILEAALALFMELGIQKPSIADIAAKANVSQVTIYNYFESKQNLTHAALIYYLEKTSKEFEEIVCGDLPFQAKLKHLIFRKKDMANQMHKELYEYFMKEYSAGSEYFTKLYTEKALPLFIRLFDEGKAQGDVDPSISNGAIMIMLHAVNEYIQREEVYPQILPMTEDIMNLFLYGLMGKRTPDS